MLALTVVLQKLDRYIPWAPWMLGRGTAHPRRNGGGF
jgi:hypothetical protein